MSGRYYDATDASTASRCSCELRVAAAATAELPRMFVDFIETVDAGDFCHHYVGDQRKTGVTRVTDTVNVLPRSGFPTETRLSPSKPEHAVTRTHFNLTETLRSDKNVQILHVRGSFLSKGRKNVSLSISRAFSRNFSIFNRKIMPRLRRFVNPRDLASAVREGYEIPGDATLNLSSCNRFARKRDIAQFGNLRVVPAMSLRE